MFTACAVTVNGPRLRSTAGIAVVCAPLPAIITAAAQQALQESSFLMFMGLALGIGLEDHALQHDLGLLVQPVTQSRD